MSKKLRTPEAETDLIDELLVKLSRDLQGLNTESDSEEVQFIQTPTSQDQYYYHFLRKNPDLLRYIKSTPLKSIREKLSALGLADGILNTVIQLTKIALDSSGNSPDAHTLFSDKTGAMAINHQRIAELLARAN